jgi:rare lipoprotein A
MRALIPVAVALIASTGGPAPAQQQRQQQQQPEAACQEEGTASFYGHTGRSRTASGEPVDPEGRTAASRDLPLGTQATVTNRQTGQSTDVRVNDRGPTRTDRAIDLSRQAARDIGMERSGTAPARIEADPARQPDPAVREQLERRRAGRPC